MIARIAMIKPTFCSPPVTPAVPEVEEELAGMLEGSTSPIYNGIKASLASSECPISYDSC